FIDRVVPWLFGLKGGGNPLILPHNVSNNLSITRPVVVYSRDRPGKFNKRFYRKILSVRVPQLKVLMCKLDCVFLFIIIRVLFNGSFKTHYLWIRRWVLIFWIDDIVG